MKLPRGALVVGLARSGQAAALALAKRDVDVIGVDQAEIDAGRLAAAGVEVRLGSEEESLLDDVELVVKSPGVPGDAPLLAAARAREIPVWSEVELGYRLLPGRLVGVTGTNGKTTTSELLGAMLEAPVAGNVGRALTDLDGQVGEDGWVVCELSSFQLEDIHEFRARVAVHDLQADDRTAERADCETVGLGVLEYVIGRPAAAAAIDNFNNNRRIPRNIFAQIF